MAKLHSTIIDDKLHVAGYVQNGDPGAVGAGILWIDTSGGTGKWVAKIRNDADDGWEGFHHPEPVTVAISPGTPVILGDDVVVTGLAPAIQTYAEGDFELVFLVSGEVVMA